MCKSRFTKQSILLPGGGDIDPIFFAQWLGFSTVFLSLVWGIAIFFPEMDNSWGKGLALLELTDTSK
jgi:hypothetical protein